MNKIAIAAFIFVLATLAFAHMEEAIKSPEEIVSEIISKQSVTSTSQIDCSKISDEEFEELGDALMEKMLGNHELHEQMDERMGGEGSESLKQMHIFMGMNWLGCTDSVGMGSGMMMPMMMRMMGNYYPAYYTGYDLTLIFTIIGWILLLVLLAYVFHLRNKIKKKRK